MKLTEDEFKAIKSQLKHKSPIWFKRIANIMGRSVATIYRIDASKDYKQYKKIIEAEHTPKNPRVPLAEQLHNARVEELNTIILAGRDGAYEAAINRYRELVL